MYRRIVALAFVCFCAAQAARAQEFTLWHHTVQVHGFGSQGYVHTGENNWLTMNSDRGSGAMSDMGLNISSQLTEKLRVGAQLYDRNLGQLGQWHPSLDWGLVDYRVRSWLGIRAGKVKTILGLYNDSQDLDFAHTFALLPQSVYPTDLRDTTIAHTGADLYGDVPLRSGIGNISYTVYAGHRSDSIYSGYPYLVSAYGLRFHSLAGLQYGGDVRWNPPLKNLLIGVSRMNQRITGKGTFADPLQPTAGAQPYQTTTNALWTNQFYGEYRVWKLQLDSEYRRYFNRIPSLPGAETAIDLRGWYVAGCYRIQKHLDVGSYYSRYTLTDQSTGAAALILPSQSDTSLPQNHVYDKVAVARVDLNRFLYVKVEGHFMNGYGIGPFPDGFYPQQNPKGFHPDTNALVVKTGVHF